MKHLRYYIVLCSVILGLCSPSGSEAQWVQTSMPDGGTVWSLAVGGTDLFAGTGTSGVFRSTDSGTRWIPINTGLTDLSVRAVALSGSDLFAGTYWRAFRSTNKGALWTAVDSGMIATVLTFAVSGANLFAGTDGGVFLSTNNGTSWTVASSGLGAQVYALAVSGTDLFAGTGGSGVFLSTDNGTRWTAVNAGLTNADVWSLAVTGTSIFAGTNHGGVFRSTNNGTRWTAVNAGMTSTDVWSLAVNGTSLFAGTAGGVFLSTNNGTTWTAVNTGLPNAIVYSLAVSGTNVFAGVGGTVWRRPLAELITAVRQASDGLSAGYELQQNYPNPFNPSTTIRYGLAARSNVTVAVLNTLGQVVATLVRDAKEAGYHEIRFDATGLSSGIYVCRLEVRAADATEPRDAKVGTGDFTLTRKLLLLK